MGKQAISVTLEQDNLTWLRGRAVAAGRLSVSEMLDRLISDARTGGKGMAGARSVVGSLQIDGADPGLARADEAIRALFARSLSRAARATRPGKARPGAGRSARGARG
jgi:hypothetical protein